MAATTVLHSLVVINCFLQSTEHVVEQNAAWFAVDVVSIASFPELLQIERILHYLLDQIRRKRL